MAATPLSQIEVSELRPDAAADWDGFVEQASASLPMHLSGWQQIITASYGHRCHFLLARQAGQIRGVLPLFEVKSPLTGHSLQSMPGAVCAESEAAGLALIRTADDLARDLKADYLLLRDSRQEWPASNLERVLAHRTILRSLSTDVDAIWRTLSIKTRYYVRKAKQNDQLNLVVTQLVDQTVLRDFYTAFAAFNHQVGTPVFGFLLLERVVQSFHSAYLLTVVYAGKTPVAGFFSLCLGGKLLGLWGASLHAYRDRYVTHLAYWAMIEHACRAGLAEFELGRAPFPSGQYDFKAAWGDGAAPVYQLYRVYRGKKPAAVQIGNPQEDTKQLSVFRQAWRKMPAGLARMLGPKIRRHMPFG